MFADSKNIVVTAQQHDHTITLTFQRNTIDFVTVRNQIHEKLRVSVPKQFIVLKYDGRRVMNDRDLLQAIEDADSVHFFVYE